MAAKYKSLLIPIKIFKNYWIQFNSVFRKSNFKVTEN